MISEFVISAVEKEQWPESDLPEVVVVGRSNVGKSSFINALTNCPVRTSLPLPVKRVASI